MSRKLATVRRVAEVKPIENADAIELIIVDGWQVVAQKGLHKEGDLVVYCEIDSLLPVRPEYEFLRKSSYVNNDAGVGFRLKTIKLRGQISQGLVLPLRELSIFSLSEVNGRWYYEPAEEDRVGVTMVCDEADPKDFFLEEAVEGTDVTAALGIIKYEKPLPTQLAGKVRGNFPSFIRKTDQERIQNCFKHLKNKWFDHTWEVTIKLDGSSMTAYGANDVDMETQQQFRRFGVCSRNLDLKEDEHNTFWSVANRYGLRDKLSMLIYPLAFQGELMGPGIQGNREQLKEVDFYVFDIWDIEDQSYFPPQPRRLIAKELGLNHVPVLFEEFSFASDVDVNQILEMAEGQSIKHPIREGLVFKSNLDPNVSFKAISNKFLLKGGE